MHAKFMAALALSLPPCAWAQNENLRPEPALIITGERASQTDQAQAEAEARPGAVSVVPAAEFEARYAVTLRDMLSFSPGVLAQPRFGEEVRLSIRGSGLNNNAHLRGVELLFDGAPINGPDGFGDFQEIDPLFASHVIVSRGANAFENGAAALGGSIAFVGHWGSEAETPTAVRLEGGSFGTSRLHLRQAWAGERFDALAAGTWQRQDGFREQSEQDNGRLYINLGAAWGPRLQSRFSLLVNDVNQEIPGALTLGQALAAPERANASNVARDFARNINSWRGIGSNRLVFGQNETLLFGASVAQRTLHHPISIVIDQDVQDATLFARYEGDSSFNGLPLSYQAGLSWREGRTEGETYQSLLSPPGARGALTGRTIQDARTYHAFGEVRLTLFDDVDLIAGLTAIDTDRDYRNLLNPAADDRARFQAVSTRYGLLWRASDLVQLFSNFSESYEPPTFSQLTQGGLADFYPIRAQQGETFEIGVRGRTRSLGFELVFYDAALIDEFVTFTTSPSDPAATRNAGSPTRHSGIEAAFDVALFEARDGLALHARTAWTHSEFRFEGDPVYGDNRLAAAPRNAARAELSLSGAHWRIAPGIEWQSGDAFVDYANHVRAPGYRVWSLSASYDVTPRATLFFEGRNLTDEPYISLVSAIADATAPGANLALFTPGEGRAAYIGVRANIGAPR